MTNTLALADRLADMSEEQAIRFARAIGGGAEELLRFRDITKETRKELFNSGLRNGEGMKQISQATAEFSARLEIAKSRLLEMFAPAITAGYKALGSIVSVVASQLKVWMDTINAIIAAVKKSLGIESNDRRTSATEKNTQAIENMNNWLKNGIYGGGDRARGAVPARYNATQPDGSYAYTAMSYGAFGL